MIDFSTLKGVTIPEGTVKQITDSNGAVLWSAKKTVKLTVTSECNSIMGNNAIIWVRSDEFYITPEGYESTYMRYEVGEEPDFTIEIPVGTTIDCDVVDSKASNRCYVAVNGETVLSKPGIYVYTVTCDISLHMVDYYAMGEYGVITITEHRA